MAPSGLYARLCHAFLVLISYGTLHAWQSIKVFASAFDNGLADRKSDFKRFNGNNQATSCPNLVKLRPVTSEFTLLKRAIFAVIRP